MAKRTRAYGLNNTLQDVFPVPVVAQRAPTSADAKSYEVGQQWIDQASTQVYILTSVSGGSATWTITGPGASDVDTLTGDTGGALSPTGGNINILGGDGITVAGAGSTLTINRDAEGGYPVTPYVVGSSGEAGYTTVQAGINAANAAGGGVVYVQPGTYTEDLTLYDGVTLWGELGTPGSSGTTIVGTHTPPNTGLVQFQSIALQDTTAIFSSAAAGSTSFFLINCAVSISNGFTFDLVNWTGMFICVGIGDIGSTDNGFSNNTGGATFTLRDISVGAGTGNTLVSTGQFEFYNSILKCPSDFQSGTAAIINSLIQQPVTFSGTATPTIASSVFSAASGAAITYNSSNNCTLTNTVISSSNSPAIDGTGAGTITLTSVDFVQDSTLSSSLTLTGQNTKTGTFETADPDAGLQISGSDIDADGGDANISITVSPKGTGDFVVDVGDIQDTAGDIIATRSNAGGDVTVEATNSDNTDPASRGGFEAAVGGTSAGDPYVNFLISGGQTYTMGIDNSTTNDDFVIADSGALGTTNRVSIDGSSGIVTLVDGLTSTGTTSILDNVNANTTINTGTSTGTVSVGNGAAGAITVDTGAGVSIDAATASNFTVTGAAEDLTLGAVGGSVKIAATEDASGAIDLTANGGTSETIVISSVQGTAADSIYLSSTAGGITASAALASTDAINLSASAGGVDIDGALEVNITSSEAAVADAVTISASAADGGITLDAGVTPGVTFTNGTQSHQMLVGSGSPNGSVTASQGSLYVDVAGATSTTILFVNTDGSTTWVGVGA